MGILLGLAGWWSSEVLNIDNQHAVVNIDNDSNQKDLLWEWEDPVVWAFEQKK
jgi:hypothetical protein